MPTNVTSIMLMNCYVFETCKLHVKYMTVFDKAGFVCIVRKRLDDNIYKNWLTKAEAFAGRCFVKQCGCKCHIHNTAVAMASSACTYCPIIALSFFFFTFICLLFFIFFVCLVFFVFRFFPLFCLVFQPRTSKQTTVFIKNKKLWNCPLITLEATYKVCVTGNWQ